MRSSTRYERRPEVKILLVDDEPVIRRLIGGMLRHLNLDIVLEEATDGSDALIKLRNPSYRPDLIITDLVMEPLNGLDFTRAVRAGQDGVDRFLPVVMVSGDQDANIQLDAIRSGVDGFLHKPVSPETLRKQVLQVLSRDAHFVEIHRPERPWFGPLTPFAKKHLLESHPHTLHHRARRLAS